MITRNKISAVRREIIKELKEKNKPLFEKLNKVERKLDFRRKKTTALEDSYETRFFSKMKTITRKDYEDWFKYWDKIEKEKKFRELGGQTIAEYDKKSDQMSVSFLKIQDDISKNEISRILKIDDIQIEITGYHYYNVDAERWLFDSKADVKIGRRIYQWWNVFDFGDIIKKKGLDPLWKSKKGYDEKDIQNIKILSKILDIGVRM